MLWEAKQHRESYERRFYTKQDRADVFRGKIERN